MNDLELAQRCINGDRQSWSDFVDRYSRLIYNYIRSILRAKNALRSHSENINDIFQDIFVLLSSNNFKKLKTFKARNGCSLASWLRQVSINFTIDYLRRQHPAVSLDAQGKEDSSILNILMDDAVSADDQLCDDEMLEQLKACIEKLTSGDKFFVHLYIYEGLTLEETMGILRISRSSVDMRKSRILEKLRLCFKKKGFEL